MTNTATNIDLNNLSDNITGSLDNVQNNIINSLLNVQSNLSDSINKIMENDMKNDLRNQIIERKYLKIGISTGWNFPEFAVFNNANTLDFTAEGYLPNIAKMHAIALFGEATLRIVDNNGNLLKDGTLEFVSTTTPNRFNKFNNKDFDILMHAVTGTVDRLVKENVKLVAPYYIVDTRSAIDANYYLPNGTFSENIQNIINQKGKCRLGTNDNCTALIFSQTVKSIWPNPDEIEVVIDNGFLDNFGSGYDIFSTDGWAVSYFSNESSVFDLLPKPEDKLIQFSDKYYIAYRQDELNNDMTRISEIILNILFRAVKLGITKENALTFDVTNNLAAEALLDGTNPNSDELSLYSILKIPNSNFGRKLLNTFGNIQEIANALDSKLGLNAMPSTFIDNYGINAYVTSA
jgi:hypothetical protein